MPCSPQTYPNGGWLAKVSDYGTANFASQLQTENPGSPVYTAESRDPALQTSKMDIYSFGVLLLEMCTCEFPVPECRAELLESIDDPQLLKLIRQCLNDNKDKRPTATQIVGFYGGVFVSVLETSVLPRHFRFAAAKRKCLGKTEVSNTDTNTPP